jgi:hypothetical protein
MNRNFFEQRKCSGHLQIEKIWEDGSSEIVFDDHNIIVSGMSVGLSILFSLSGSDRITDFQLDRFQVGVSGWAGNEVSSTYELSGPLSSTEEYVGTAGNLITLSSVQIKNKVDTADQVFALIPFSHVTRLNDTSVRYTLVLDKESANNITRGGVSVPLNEVGLVMKNPRGNAETASILCAYRVFSDQVKTSEFSLVFRWTINF